jgi:hypothetical protein
MRITFRCRQGLTFPEPALEYYNFGKRSPKRSEPLKHIGKNAAQSGIQFVDPIAGRMATELGRGTLGA